MTSMASIPQKEARLRSEGALHMMPSQPNAANTPSTPTSAFSPFVTQTRI